MDDLLSCLRAAAEPTRLRLLALCAEGEMTVSDLTAILGQSQPRVSRHLKLLCEAGLLDRFREGSWVFYRLADNTDVRGGIARRLVEMIPDGDAQLALDRARLREIKRSHAVDAADYFRANAEKWDEIRSLHIDEGDVEQAIAAAFPDHAGDLLDIGTGTGRMLQLLSHRIDRGVGIDSSREMLAVARANLEARALRHCHVRHGDMYRLEMTDLSVDAVIIHQVLHYAELPGSVIAEAARVLRPGGTLIIVDFAPHDLEMLRTDHAHRWLGIGDEEVSEWLAAADLLPGGVRQLPGEVLTVMLWTARRPVEGAEQIDKPDIDKELVG